MNDHGAKAQGHAPGAGSPSQASVVVKVLLMGELKRWAGAREVEMDLPQGSTVRTVAAELAARCGREFAKRAVTEEGFQADIAVFLNGEDIRKLADSDTRLAEGQLVLMLLPAYEGGSLG